jgi:hypothetical protein
MSVAYDGNGPFRGLAPQVNMTYMQRQRQRAASLASGGDKLLMGGGASIIGKALRSGVRSWYLHLRCSQVQALSIFLSRQDIFSKTSIFAHG